ncbi:hypothetical protein FNV43_RR21548 [Rhamnella rubrinervis]|uniref:Uncharacterized protein n=1 Tax=Rhamnella rubrinervis TaxID=2594499 RepID=A0A8K0E2H0_9ROSA|nr:hypothetical protein FNV43_RR21548 [Rhamnella rubrinervis]
MVGERVNKAERFRSDLVPHFVSWNQWQRWKITLHVILVKEEFVEEDNTERPENEEDYDAADAIGLKSYNALTGDLVALETQNMDREGFS